MRGTDRYITQEDDWRRWTKIELVTDAGSTAVREGGSLIAKGSAAHSSFKGFGEPQVNHHSESGVVCWEENKSIYQCIVFGERSGKSERLSGWRRIQAGRRVMDGSVVASKRWDKAIQPHYANLSACLSADYARWLARGAPSNKVSRGGKETELRKSWVGEEWVQKREKKGDVWRVLKDGGVIAASKKAWACAYGVYRAGIFWHRSRGNARHRKCKGVSTAPWPSVGGAVTSSWAMRENSKESKIDSKNKGEKMWIFIGLAVWHKYWHREWLSAH